MGKNSCRAQKGFSISIPLGENVDIDHLYKGIKVDIKGCEMSANLIPLELHDFDVILGMDWIGTYRAQLDCFEKTVTLYGPNGRTMIFRCERNVIPDYMISIITTRKLMKKGCMTYLAYVIDSKKGNVELSNVLIVREFSEELPRLPLEREV